MRSSFKKTHITFSVTERERTPYMKKVFTKCLVNVLIFLFYTTLFGIFNVSLETQFGFWNEMRN